jgi:hypothetical protein
MLGHTSLAIYYQTMFSMVQHHKYTLTELDGLIPYELDIYIDMLAAFLKEQEARNRNK